VTTARAKAGRWRGSALVVGCAELRRHLFDCEGEAGAFVQPVLVTLRAERGKHRGNAAGRRRRVRGLAGEGGEPG
jgi:hypothetical protein